MCACRVRLVQVLAMEPEEVPPPCPPLDRDRVGFIPRVRSMRMGFVIPRFTEHVHVNHEFAGVSLESHGLESRGVKTPSNANGTKQLPLASNSCVF